jgi:integrase
MTAAVARINGNAADGIHFHDPRHSHETWMIEDDVAEVAQYRRLGHARVPLRPLIVSAETDSTAAAGADTQLRQQPVIGGLSRPPVVRH